MYRLYLYKFLIDFWLIVPFYRAHGLSAMQILTVQRLKVETGSEAMRTG